MPAIDDNDLILYHYDDGLAPERRALIDAALAVSPDLRARYACLRATLAAVDRVPIEPPDAGFEERMWQSIEARMAGDVVALRAQHPPLRDAMSQRRRRPRWRIAFAAAASLVVLLGAGFLAGRISAPDVPAPTSLAATPHADLLATRVLDAYVAAHLRDTEGVLLTALNSDSPELAAGNADLAAALIDSNRLYTEAAQRAGNTRLADFLRQMEPVLIELANPPRGDGIEVRDGLREYVRESDLLFRVRATEGALATRKLRT